MGEYRQIIQARGKMQKELDAVYNPVIFGVIHSVTAMQTNPAKISRPRGGIAKSDCTLISFWAPANIAAALDAAVKAQDTDRSKLIRRAVRRELETLTPA